MTRKHFIQIAAAIKIQIDGAASDHDPIVIAARHVAVVRIAQEFARIAADDNHNFDTGRFYRACGIKF